jgi:hypothetical protein
VKIEIEVGEKAFEFTSQIQWVNKGRSWFSRLNGRDTICLAADGRVVKVGKQFREAEERGAYPVSVYLIDPEPKEFPDAD